jgi:hypothetical protein
MRLAKFIETRQFILREVCWAAFLNTKKVDVIFRFVQWGGSFG